MPPIGIDLSLYPIDFPEMMRDRDDRDDRDR